MTINRQAIIDAALEILDSYGLADLSMRRLAAQLGVKAATIYWHFSNKQSLLAGVSDAIVAPVGEAATLADWAYSFREALLAHRDGADVVAATRAVGLGEILPEQHGIEVLVAQGVPEDDARRYALTMTHFVLGHVANEQARRNLIDFGVLPSDFVARDDDGFATGVRVIHAGIDAGLPG